MIWLGSLDHPPPIKKNGSINSMHCMLVNNDIDKLLLLSYFEVKHKEFFYEFDT
jgi:hypothetical protein